MREGQPIDTCPIRGRWWDIGTPSSYLRTNLDWLEHNANTALGSFVSPSATVAAGVVVESSVLGAGARVTGSGLLRDCVVWPGSTAIAPLSGCVVTPRVVVRAGGSPVP